MKNIKNQQMKIIDVIPRVAKWNWLICLFVAIAFGYAKNVCLAL